MDIQELKAYQQSLENNGLFKVENINMCTVFDVESNKYAPSELCDPKEYKFIDMLNIGWMAWQQAQKVAVPEGFVLVEKSKTEHWYLDEGENMWMEEPDNWLCDIDIGEVQAVEHKEYLVTESNTLYATKVWDDENSDADTWQFFKSQDEAEKAAAHCKAKFWEEEAQEQVG